MAKDLFSVPIFFIIFRETIEASIVISVLLGFVEQLVHGSAQVGTVEENDRRIKTLIRRMRIQIWAGALTGGFIALAIGAAFVAVWYTTLSDLWQQTESLWEGIFSILSSLIILVMGLAFLRMDRSRAKWRIKLQHAFANTKEDQTGGIMSIFRRNKNKDNRVDLPSQQEESAVGINEKDEREGKSGKWALFLLPFITVLREGLEAVVFVAGVSISQPASATPIAVIVGLIAGFCVGFLIYRGGNAFALHTFLIISTCILFLVGAGLFSKGVWFAMFYPWAKKVGGDVAESGAGPGSYDVRGVIWHVNYGNPELTDNGGWMVFNAIFGWNNTGTYGSVLSYIAYWLFIAATLVYLKWQEGRIALCGIKSKTLREREERHSLGHHVSGTSEQIQRTPSGLGSGDSAEYEKKGIAAHGANSPEQEVEAQPLGGRH